MLVSQPLSFPDKTKNVTFIEGKDVKIRFELRNDSSAGITSLCGAGEPDMKTGISIHIYSANSSMEGCAFCNSDGLC